MTSETAVSGPSQSRPTEVGEPTAMTGSPCHDFRGGIGSGRLSRRRVLQHSLACAMSSWGASSITHQGVAQEAPRRPNFVVIVTDDMRASDWQALPQTRQLLADGGVTFPNFFATTPACSPARTSILTGQYAHEHGVWIGDIKDRKADVTGASTFDQLGLAEKTIAVALHNAGYRTALVGKYLNGFGIKRSIPPGWDDWYSTSSTDYVDFELNENGAVVNYTGQDQYVTDVLAEKAVETIASAPPDQPLFLYFAAKAPHEPSTPARRHVAAFNDARVAEDPSVGEGDMSDKPAFLRRRRSKEIPVLISEERDRLKSLLAVDEAVVRIIAALESAGRMDNTYIFVLSDHGYAMGQHGWTSKALPYDAVTRVQMMALGPELEAGVIDERLVTNCDIAPTIAELAGATFDAASGRSLLSEGERSVVLLENRPAAAPYYSALRSKQRLYVEWDSGERELYDYRTDPFELDNALADWEGHTPAPGDLELAAVLHDRLALLATCTGSDCHAAEDAPLEG
jgi:N-acetylglucosamine-6-sulfatase